MANRYMVDSYVTAVTAVPHDAAITFNSTGGERLTLPVESDKLDLTFTIQANVVNTVINDVGTQEVRIGKTHIVKTVHFELTNGTITTCTWEPWSEG